MRAKHTALILTAGFLLLPTISWSQFPGMGGPGGGGFGGGGMRRQFDPDQFFNMMSGGKDVIVFDQVDPNFRPMVERMASRYGFKGQVTRDQYKAAMAQRMASRAESGGLNFRMPSGGVAGGPMALGTQPMAASGDDGRDRRVEEYFKSLDLNQNGVLEHHELVGDPVAEDLSREFDKYDTNQDGFIDLNEFKAYMLARNGPQDGKAAGGAKADDQKKRPVVIRGGNLPADFPFASLDRDGDGQIGLYEWKESGKRIAEFLAMDLNNDGFLTVDEYYRWKKADDQANGRSTGSAFARGNGRGMPGTGGPNMLAMGGAGSGSFGTGTPGFGGGRFGTGMPGFGGRGGPFAFGGGDRGAAGDFAGRRGFRGDRGGPGGSGDSGDRRGFRGWPGSFGGGAPGGSGDNPFSRFGGRFGSMGGPPGGGGSFTRSYGDNNSRDAANNDGGGKRRGGRGKDRDTSDKSGKPRGKFGDFGGKQRSWGGGKSPPR